MVNPKRKGNGSSSKSKPQTNNVADPTATTAPSPIKINAGEIVVVPEIKDKEENVIEEIKTVENATKEEKDEEKLKEVEENNGETEIEEEENNEENESEDEDKNEENAIEKEEENSEETARAEDENANEKVENEENSKEEETKEKIREEGSKDKINTLKKRNRNKKVARKGLEAVAVNDKDKPELSAKGKKKATKKVESMGMIFMCSSKTKKDCFRYKVLGLPASKRDVVEKIYRGMRVFLFDLDLRLMYGIYKAAAPGGYNLEPKAFKSAFPSQVRFTVFEDCLPLAEEKFKKVIKENYFSKNKFDCQLNSTQVKNLCKLFLAANKGPKPKRPGTSRRAEIHTFVDQDRIRDRARDDERRAAPSGAHRHWGEERERRTVSGRKRRYPDEERRNASGGGDRRYRDEERRRPALVVERRYRDEERLPSLGGDRLYHERPIVYKHEAFAPPVARVQPLPPPDPASYNYGRSLEIEAYRREPLYEHREHQLLDLDRRPRVVIEQRDPYTASYSREPPLHRDSFYPRGPPAEYHPAGTGYEYRTAGLASEYRTHAAPPPSEYRSTAAMPPPEYTSLRPLYRY